MQALVHFESKACSFFYLYSCKFYDIKIQFCDDNVKIS